MSWSERVNELLYDGEAVREEVPVGEHEVVVTSHRVLAFTSALPSGPNYRAIERPNVEGVTTSLDSDAGALQKAVLWGAFALVLVVGGVLFEVGSLFSIPENLQEGAVGGTGGMISAFTALLEALALVDEAVAVLGVLLLAYAAFYGYRYRESREHVVAIGVAGDADVRLPVPDEDAQSTAARRIQQALATDTTHAATDRVRST
jgi:hypothetical protein